MTNALFYSNFRFNEFSHTEAVHADNSGGVSSHFIGYIKKGYAEIQHQGNVLRLNKGDLFYIPKGLCYHSYWYPHEGAVIFDSFGFQNIPLPSNERYKLQILQQNETITQLLSELSENKKTGCKAIGLFYLLLSELLDDMKKENPDPKRDIVDKARCYMMRNDSYSIADVAKHCSVSQSGFYAIYKEVTGTTPQNIKNSIRIQKCMDLLTVEGLTVEQVSEKMGFSSSSYFRKVFKKYMGINPSQVRKGAKISMP